MPARFSRSSKSWRRSTLALAAATADSSAAISAAPPLFPEEPSPPEQAASTASAASSEMRANVVLIRSSSAPAHGILVVERRHVCARIRRILLRGRRVRRDAGGRREGLHGVGLGVEPAALI